MEQLRFNKAECLLIHYVHCLTFYAYGYFFLDIKDSYNFVNSIVASIMGEADNTERFKGMHRSP